MKLAVLNLDGRVSYVEITNKEMLLATLQSIVGGYIEVLTLTEDKVLIMNEDGKLEGLPVNKTATGLLRIAYRGSNDMIAGTAVLMDRKDL